MAHPSCSRNPWLRAWASRRMALASKWLSPAWLQPENVYGCTRALAWRMHLCPAHDANLPRALHTCALAL
eukprot:700653-Alexandrium_andersonii.AAC.1